MCKCEELERRFGVVIDREFCPLRALCEAEGGLLKRLPKQDRPVVTADSQVAKRFPRPYIAPKDA